MTEHRGDGRAPQSSADDSPGFRRFGLRTMLVTLLAVAFLPAGVLAVVQSLNAYTNSVRFADRGLLLELRSAVQSEAVAFTEARGALAVAAQELASGPLDRETCARVADALKAADPNRFGAHFTTVQGEIFCGSDGYSGGVNVRGDASFQAFLDDPVFRVTALRSRISEEARLVAAYPVSLGDTLLGAVSISFAPDVLRRIETRMTRGGQVALAPIGSVEATEAQALAAPISGDDWAPNARLLRELTAERPVVRRGESVGGAVHVYAVVGFGGGGLTAIAGWPTEALSRAPEGRVLLGVGLPLAAWVLAAGVVVVALRYLVMEQLDRLAESTARLRAGRRVTTPMTNSAPLEFAQLGAEFDEMASTIIDREARLETALAEQKLLLKEVYHRVKNNLQLIVSLLNMQLRAATTEDERRIVRTTQNRVQTLALVHQNLYSIGQLVDVRLDVLLRELAPSLRSLRTETAGQLRLDLVLEPVTMDAEHAAPASLFATEAIINAIKYTPIDDGEAVVEVMLRAEGTGFRLEVTNPAPGGASLEMSSASIGLRLMKGFARQLSGEMTRSARGGVYCVSLLVPDTTPTAKRYSVSIEEDSVREA